MAQEQPFKIKICADGKRWLRRFLVKRRQSLSLLERKRKSAQISNTILRSSFYRRSKTIAVFLSFGSEVNTRTIVRRAWKDKKNVLIPISSPQFKNPKFALFRHGDKLIKTSHGPLEFLEKKKPFDFKKIDLVLVPGLGFDQRGYRLGYGGGVYDRILEKTSRAKHVGLFFEAQKLEHCPREKHDQKLHVIVTEKRLLKCLD